MGIEQIQNLINNRYDSGVANVNDFDIEIFTKGLSLVNNLFDKVGCVWCRYPRVCGELLRLFSFPSNEFLKSFKKITQKCLSRCFKCIYNYYIIREELELAFSKIYESESLIIFWEAVLQYDIERITFALQFIDKPEPPNSIIYASQEILFYPPLLLTKCVQDAISSVVKFVLSSRSVPSCLFLGNLYELAFDENRSENPEIMNYLKCRSLLNDQKSHSIVEKKFLPGSLFDVNRLLCKINWSNESHISCIRIFLKETGCLYFNGETTKFLFEMIIENILSYPSEAIELLAEIVEIVYVNDFTGALRLLGHLLSKPPLFNLMKLTSATPVFKSFINNLGIKKYDQLKQSELIDGTIGLLMRPTTSFNSNLTPYQSDSNATRNLIETVLPIIEACDDISSNSSLISFLHFIEMEVKRFQTDQKLVSLFFSLVIGILCKDASNSKPFVSLISAILCRVLAGSEFLSHFMHALGLCRSKEKIYILSHYQAVTHLIISKSSENASFDHAPLFLMASILSKVELSAVYQKQLMTSPLKLIEAFYEVCKILKNSSPDFFKTAYQYYHKLVLMDCILSEKNSSSALMHESNRGTLSLVIKIIFILALYNHECRESVIWAQIFDGFSIAYDLYYFHYLRHLQSTDPEACMNRIISTPEFFNSIMENCLAYISITEGLGGSKVAKVCAILLQFATRQKISIFKHVSEQLAFVITCVQDNLTETEKQLINKSIESYENRLGIKLSKPIISQNESSNKIKSSTVLKNNVLDVFDERMETQLLNDLKLDTKKSRVSHQSGRTGTIRIESFSMSKMTKFDQLRAAAITDSSLMNKTGLGIGVSAMKKPRIIMPNTLVGSAKAAKMDLYRSETSCSSDSEGEITKQNCSKSKVSGENNENDQEIDSKTVSRSVKIIDLPNSTRSQTDQKSSLGSTRIIRKEQSAILREIDVTKRFHRSILNIHLTENQDMYSPKKIEKQILEIFNSFDQYVSTFEPLLLLECRAIIAKTIDCHEENLINSDSSVFHSRRSESSEAPGSSFTVCLLISSLSHEDNFLQVIAKEYHCKPSNPSNKVGDSNRLHEQDYLMLSFADKELRPAIISQVSSRNGIFEYTMRLLLSKKDARLQLELVEGRQIRVKRLENLVTSHREFLALHFSDSCIFSQVILNPGRLSSIPKSIPNVLSKRQMENLHINPSQERAINAVLGRLNSIVLIQGPPGTGKTRTIDALIRAIISLPLRPNARRGEGRVLVCAPSNAAVDEISRRVRHLDVQIIRIGSSEAIADDLKDLMIDSQVEAIVKSLVTDLRDKESMEAEINGLMKELDMIGTSDTVYRLTVQEKLKASREKLLKITKAGKKNGIEERKHRARETIISNARIVCCTLSSSAQEIISRLEFDHIIIDEACQAVELSCLVPLMLRCCKQLTLVGDPNQLPPTVISQVANDFSYDQSLFVRIQKATPGAVVLLDTQYRMHPEISRFPNSYFYEGLLIDGPNMKTLNTRPWHQNPILKPLVFFDVSAGKETAALKGQSKVNQAEVKVVANIISLLSQECPELPMGGRIGVVTPYSEQRRAIRRQIYERFGPKSFDCGRIEVSTVDGFQGQEREIIIFSCVRTGETSGLGFLKDTRRLNVAITRAKCSLFIVGRAQSLAKYSIWRSLIDDCSNRGNIVHVGDDFGRSFFDQKFRKNADYSTTKENTKFGNSKCPSMAIDKEPNFPAPNMDFYDDSKKIGPPPVKKVFKIETPLHRQSASTTSATNYQDKRVKKMHNVPFDKKLSENAILKMPDVPIIVNGNDEKDFAVEILCSGKEKNESTIIDPKNLPSDDLVCCLNVVKSNSNELNRNENLQNYVNDHHLPKSCVKSGHEPSNVTLGDVIDVGECQKDSNGGTRDNAPLFSQEYCLWNKPNLNSEEGKNSNRALLGILDDAFTEGMDV